ncbi:LamG domain-containing protein [Streptomyces echinatus]|uniref:LamG domain-containing protein n=1 Tax=Streptomyces echinatus TaxID=67293 RepID=UPI0037972988
MRRRRPRSVALGLGIVLSSALLVPATTARAEDEPRLTAEQQALSKAQETGERVELPGRRTEHTTVFANPDGSSFHLEESSVPVRVRNENGGWQTPDPTLEVRADGTIAPKAAAVDMEFSGGGKDDPLVRIAGEGRSLALAWPGGLPKPELDGPSALYPDVLPDVDLKVTASTEGFQHVLIVKSPKAAASPRLKQVTYGLKASGLDLHEGRAGNLMAVDGDGQTVFRAPPAQMWDSAGDTAAPVSRTATGSAAPGRGAAARTATSPAKNATPAGSTPSSAAGSTPSSAAGSTDLAAAAAAESTEPGAGDKVAKMDVEITKDSLSVTPDATMLGKTAAEHYPLFIDPNVTWSESERTLLRSDGYESYGWGNGDDGLGKGVGKCGTWNSYYCGPGYVQRLYFEFSPASLKGKRVLDATFRVTEPWAFQCDPRWVDLVRTDNISSSTTWSGRPKEQDWMVDRHVSAGRGSLCDPDSPDAPIEFNDNPEESNENLTPTVRDFAAGKFSRLTLEIRAHDEGDTGAWKRFKNDGVLSVDFVGLPAKPTSIGVVTGTGTVCETKESDPAIVSSPEPLLRATAQTASGGEKDAQLRVAFDVDAKSGDTWTDAPIATNGDIRPSAPAYATDNAAVSLTWPKLTEGTLYRYRAWVRSYYNKGDSYLAGPSNASTTGWCYFKVDPTAPKAPQISVSSPYTLCTTSDCTAHGGPGQKMTFTFAKGAAGDTNIAGYQYKLSTSAPWSSTLPASKPNVTVLPNHSGTLRVYARAVDNVGSGRPGAQNVVDVLVDAGQRAVGRWQFGESSGAAVDSADAPGTTRHDATLAGGATRDDRGRRGLITHDASGVPLDEPVTDRGLSLDGSTGYAATGGPVLETRSSYTLSAWTRVNPGQTGTATVLSQDGGTYTPFYLSYNLDGSGAWSMRTLTLNGTTRSWSTVRAKQPTPRGVWTHVAAVYDGETNKVGLYLNGVLQAETDAGTPWAASGALQIGRARWLGENTDYFNGSVDEVAVWQRALGDTEIADEARLLTSQGFAGAELVADWSADRGSGTTVADTTSGYGKQLGLTGGASLDGEAIVLDGVDDAATASGPIVDDTGSFTVTTAVELDGGKLAGKSVGYTGQVLGQRTADGSGWGLWYELTGKDTVLDEETGEERTVSSGKWHFGRLRADGGFDSVVSDEAAATDSVVRLTGVFNAQDGTLSLYLGHNQNGDDLVFTAQAGSGEFAVGKGFTGGAWKHYLPGRIAEVRLWAGAMASPDQIDARVGD